MAQSTILRAKNITGATLTAGTVVYISGFDEDTQIPYIAKASYDNEAKMPAVGVVREDILHGDTDIVKITGPVDGFDTSNVSVNTNVYVGQDGRVVFTDEPSSLHEDLLTQQLGTVIKSEDFPNGLIQLFPLELKRRIRHPELADVWDDQHHYKLHAEHHRPGEIDEFLHARQHETGGGDEVNHNLLPGLDADAHIQYSLIDGTRAFTGVVGGITPTADAHLTTKGYVDLHILQDGSEAFTGTVDGIWPTSDDHLATKEYVDFVVPGQVWRDPVIDKDLTTAPGGSNTGDRYVVGAVISGVDDWYGEDDKIAVGDGPGWDFYTPDEGWVIWVEDENALYGFNGIHGSGGTWSKITGAVLTGSGTQGYITYWTGVDSLDGESNLFWDDTNKRLGINTDTPDTGLHILNDEIRVESSTGAIISLRDSAGGTNSKQWNLEADTESLLFSTINDAESSSETWFGAYRTGLNVTNIRFSTSGTERVRITGSNVGIGITSPVEILDINGAIRIGTNSNTNAGTIRWTGTDFEGYTGTVWNSFTTAIAAGTDGQVQYNDGGTTAGASALYYDDVNSRVGIGTTGPNEMLTIEGALSLDEITAPSATSGYGKIYVKSSDSLLYFKDDAGTEYLLTSGGISGSGSAGQVAFWSSGTVLTGESNLFWNSTTDRLGISQSTPAAKLDIYESTALGTTTNNSQLISRTSGLTGTNEFRNEIYLRRDASGSSWNTARWHDAIGIDSSYQTPGTDTKVWWERDPSNELQSWGNASTTWMTLDGIGLGIAKHLSVGGNIINRDLTETFETIRIALDGYTGADPGLSQTVQEHYNQHGEALQAIIKDLDGYSSDTGLAGTVQEHYNQHSEALQTIIKELDGYSSDTGLDQTVSEHYKQHGDALQTILTSLDGYGTGTGTGTGNTEGYGQDGYLAVFSDEDTILGEPDLFFDRDDGYLGVGTTAPNERVTIDGALSMVKVASPIEEAGHGKLYVNINNGRIFFKMEDGQDIDLTKFDIDGGSFTDVFNNTNDFDAGEW